MLAKVLYSRSFKTRAGQAANSISFVDSAKQFGRATFIGHPPPVGCIEGAFIEINGTVKIPSRFCASGFACEVLPKSATFKVVDPTDDETVQFLPDGSLPALTTGPQGEVSLSGSPDQFSCVDRARCPTPAIREPMEPFKPRALTETVVRRFFLKHNKAKLEVPGFIANLMKLPDDEIRSKCQARYHATPEPAHDDFDI